MLLVATVIKNTVQIVDKVVKRIFKLVMQERTYSTPLKLPRG